MVIERDVIVVGAGPAGSAISCALAHHGLDVLLLDRASFPRDKTCGDEIILSNPVKNVSEATGWFGRELNYLVEQGFRLSADGTRMSR